MGRVYTASSDIASFTSGDIVEIISPSGSLVFDMTTAITAGTLEWSVTFEELGG